jgi:vanillate O-demethylase ferredoxin subunit
VSDKLQSRLSVRVEQILNIAVGIKQLRLRRADGGQLPAAPAGSHIDVQLPNGLRRSYSLITPETCQTHYDIAVARDPASRGGSAWVHDYLMAGALLEISTPRNNFPLHNGPAPAVLIAGGIGITPIWAMVQSLVAQGRSWRLHYACRSRERAAFLEVLHAAASASGGDVQAWWDDEHGGRPLDVADVVSHAPSDAHLYCCGPAPMLDAFLRATEAWPRDRVHIERFQASDAPMPSNGLSTFKVELVRTGRVIDVPEGSTILEACMINGIDVPYSCCEGLCGTCETRVLAGIPDHRDSLLTERAKQANDTIIICCSGSKTPLLVLDL